MQPSDPQPSARGFTAEAPPPPRFGAGLRRIVRGRQRRIAEGLALGTLIGLCASLLGISELVPVEILRDFVAFPALAGLVVGLSPLRRLLRITAGAMMGALLIVAYTPLAATLTPALERSDPLEPAPAVVILSTAAHKDRTLDAAGQERALQGFLLLRQGYSDRLVLTRSIPRIGDSSATVLAQMRMLRFNFRSDVVGPVANTHDEALAVARLARERGWTRVILVTHPWHMRRARGVFLKAGLGVLCSPCVEGSYDRSDLRGPGDRLNAFRDWVHETVGFAVYRLRGWL